MLNSENLCCADQALVKEAVEHHNEVAQRKNLPDDLLIRLKVQSENILPHLNLNQRIRDFRAEHLTLRRQSWGFHTAEAELELPGCETNFVTWLHQHMCLSVGFCAPALDSRLCFAVQLSLSLWLKPSRTVQWQ